MKSGSSWAVAQKLELVPSDQEKIASIEEARTAAKEFKHDSMVQRQLGKWWWQEDSKGGFNGKKGESKDGKGGKRPSGSSGGANKAKLGPYLGAVNSNFPGHVPLLACWRSAGRSPSNFSQASRMCIGGVSLEFSGIEW